MSDAPIKTILIVEDEDAIRLTLRDYLRKRGYEALVASDGVGAIKQLLDNNIQFIITDYRMEILGGDYWIKFLQRFVHNIPIVITSGFLRPEFDIPYHVVYKPYDYADLEQYIREYNGSQQS